MHYRTELRDSHVIGIACVQAPTQVSAKSDHLYAKELGIKIPKLLI